MKYDERVLAFECAGQRLVGVASVPASPQPLGLLVVVGGPQYRAGSHRQFVEITRYAAAHGFAAMRFDVRGMGDSEGDCRAFDEIDDDIGAALVAFIHAVPSVQRVVLWGLCDGASAALLYLDRHSGGSRVAGLCLANPWVRSEASLAQTHVKHYYRDRLRQRDFWLKLLSGRVAWKALRDLVANLRLASQGAAVAGAGLPHLPFQQRMARAWQASGVPLLVVLSGRDYTAREFLQVCETDPAWRGALDAPNVQRLDVSTADHTFSARADRARLEQALADWLAGLVRRLPPRLNELPEGAADGIKLERA